MGKIKKFFRQISCNHFDADMIRWHWTHGPMGNDPASVEAEYRCNDCEKMVYMHLYGKEACEWAKAMRDYKKV